MEDSLKDGLIISGVTIASFMILKYLLHLQLSSMLVMRLINRGYSVFVKDYLVYMKYISE